MQHIALLFLLFVGIIARTQTYPVQAFVQVSPPYNSYLPDYADPFTNQMKVLLTLTDFSIPSTQVKLKFEIEGPGYSIQSVDLIAFPTITLTPGMPVEISGSALAPYLATENLVFSGISPSDYELSKILPEGPATICVKVIDVTSAGQPIVGNPACGQTWFSLYDPPLLNLPFCGTELTKVDPQALLFSWTPLHMASPLAGETEYIFELFEIRPDMADPNVTVEATLPIYTETTINTFVNYGIVQPILITGMSYVWRVKARDPSMRDLYRNNGYSAVCTFTWGSIAGALIEGITLELNSNGTGVRQGLTWWNASDLFDNYILEVRKTGNPAFEWFPYEAAIGERKVNSLEPETEYECRVKGVAGGAETDWSNVSTFTTQAQPDYACGSTALPGISPLNQPLEFLLPGDIVATGQFEITVTSVEPLLFPGHFRGYGKVHIPFMLMNMNVLFDDIYIDDNMVMRQGRVDVITDGIDAWVADFGNIYIPGIINQPGGFEFGADSLLTVHFGDESLEFDFRNGDPLIFVDESGLVYTVYSDGTITVGGSITWDDDELAATADHVIHFHAYNSQDYGFDEKEYLQWQLNYPCIALDDGSLYFVPYKSVGSGDDDIVVASITSTETIISPTFKYANGTVLSSIKIDDSTYNVTVGNVATSKMIYAYDDLGAKIGKTFLSVYAEKANNVVVVPVNGAIVPADLETYLNETFAQANVSFDLTTAANYDNDTYDVNSNGLESPDATLMQKYSLEMRSLRDAYFDEFEKENDTYYIFVVPEFDSPLDGYMVRGKAIGFIKSDESVHTYAHELAHGAFGLEHTFPSVSQGTTENLLDYTADGNHLTHDQWYDMQHFTPVFSILDDEEDGSLVGFANLSSLEHLLNESSYFTFVDPVGKLVSIVAEGLEYVLLTDLFDEAKDGLLQAFSINGVEYEAVYSGSDFNGYAAGGIYYSDNPVSNPSEIEHILYGVACYESNTRVYRIYDLGPSTYLSSFIGVDEAIAEEHLHQADSPQHIEFFTIAYSELEYSTIQVNFNDNESVNNVLGALKTLKEAFGFDDSEFCGYDYALARKLGQILISKPYLANCLDDLADNFSLYLAKTESPEEHVGYIAETDNAITLNYPLIDVYTVNTEFSFEDAEDYFNHLYSYFALIDDGINEIAGLLDQSLDVEEDINIGELADNLFDVELADIYFYGVLDCYLNTLNFSQREQIFEQYVEWTLGGQKEDLLLSTLRSTPEDQYSEVLDYFEANASRRLAIITELSGADEIEFASSLAYIAMKQNKDEFLSLTSQPGTNISKNRWHDEICGESHAVGLDIFTCSVGGETVEISPLYFEQQLRLNCEEACENFEIIPYASNLEQSVGNATNIYYNKLSFYDDQYYYYDLHSNAFIYFEAYDFIPFQISENGNLTNFSGERLFTGNTYWAPAFYVSYIQALTDFNENIQDLRLAANITFAVISAYAMMSGDVTGTTAKIFWTISESISLYASAIDIAIVTQEKFVEENGTLEEYERYHELLEKNSAVINTLMMADVTFGVTIATRQLVKYVGTKSFRKSSQNLDTPVNTDHVVHNVDEIIKGDKTYVPVYEDGIIVAWRVAGEGELIPLKNNMGVVYDSPKAPLTTIPGTTKTYTEFIEELESVITSLKGIATIGRLENLLNVYEDLHANLKLNLSSYGNRNIFVIENKQLGIQLPQNPEVVYGNLAEVVYTSDVDFYLKPNNMIRNNEPLTKAELEEWIYSHPGYAIVAGLEGIKIKDVDGVVRECDAYVVKSGTDYYLLPQLIHRIEKILEVGDIVGFYKLTGKSSLSLGSFRALDEALVGVEGIKYAYTGQLVQTPKKFLNELGDDIYDIIYPDGSYAKYDNANGRMLYYIEGKYYFVRYAADFNSDNIEAYMRDKLTRIRNYLGLNGPIRLDFNYGLGSAMTGGGRKIYIIGKNTDILKFKNQFGNFKHIDVGESVDGVVILNMPNPYFNASTWYLDHNRDWIIGGVADEGEFFCASPINDETLYNIDNKTKQEYGSYYANELNDLILADKKPANITQTDWELLRTDIQTAASIVKK